MFILILTLKIILFLYFLDQVFLGPSKLFITITINHGDTYKEENSYTIDSIQMISLRIFSFKIGVLIFDFFYFKTKNHINEIKYRYRELVLQGRVIF